MLPLDVKIGLIGERSLYLLTNTIPNSGAVQGRADFDTWSIGAETKRLCPWWPPRGRYTSCAGPCRVAPYRRAADGRRSERITREVDAWPISCGSRHGLRARARTRVADVNDHHERRTGGPAEHAHAREHPARHRENRHVVPNRPGERARRLPIGEFAFAQRPASPPPAWEGESSTSAESKLGGMCNSRR